MFIEFDFVGGPFNIITPILAFDFHLPRTPGYPWSPQGPSDQKVAWNKKRTAPDFRGNLFTKNVILPKIWLALWPGPPSSPVFSGRGQKIKILLPSFFSPRCPDSKKVWHNPPAPKPSEEIDLSETPFLGSGPDSEVQVIHQKLLARS